MKKLLAVVLFIVMLPCLAMAQGFGTAQRITTLGNLFSGLGSPAAGSVSLISNGTTVTGSPMYVSIGECSFPDYLTANGLTVVSSTTRTDYLQRFLLDCQLKYINLVGNTSWDNLTFPTGITAVIPNLAGDFGINSMIVVPRYVHTKFFAQPVRVGSVGTPSTDWQTSNTGTSLATLYSPMIWFMPGSGEDPSVPLKAHLYATAGVDYGSGVYYGGFLQIKTATLAAGFGGTGMVNGETCRIQSGDQKQPYGSPTVVITVVAGSVTAVTYTGTEFGAASPLSTSPGAFGLLPYQQATQWTAANGYNNGVGTFASPVTYKPTVFTATGGHYLLNCPSGSQTAAVDLTWYKPFEHNYWEPKFTTASGFGGIAYTDYVGDIYTDQGDPASAISATYGPKISFLAACHDCTLGRIENSIGNDEGFELLGTDIRSTGGLNSVGAGVCGVIRSGGGLTADIVCDTNRVDGLHISNYDNFQIRLNSFHNSTSSATFTGPLLYMGDPTYGGGATQLVSNGQVSLTGYSSGTGGAALTAVKYDFSSADNIVYLNASNTRTTGAARAQPISTAVQYTANALGGGIEGVASAAADSTLVVGTPPTASLINIKNTTTGNSWKNNQGQVRLEWVSGRFYGPLVAPLATVNSRATANPFSGFTLIPIEVPRATTLASLAFEITTASAAAINYHVCVYPSVNGIPDNTAPLIDSGIVAVAGAGTGSQLISAASWSVGSAATVIPAGVVWAGLMADYNALVPAFRAINAGSAGGGTVGGDLGLSLTSGVSTSGQNYAGRIVSGFTFAACPSTFTTALETVNANVPIVWLGK
jgi:hypothetical protein